MKEDSNNKNTIKQRNVQLKNRRTNKLNAKKNIRKQMKKQTSHKQTEQQLPPETVGSRTIKSFQRASQDLILKEAEAGNDE